MNDAQLTGGLEAMLFAHAEPVETERLADALRLDPERTEQLLQRPGLVLVYLAAQCIKTNAHEIAP